MKNTYIVKVPGKIAARICSAAGERHSFQAGDKYELRIGSKQFHKALLQLKIDNDIEAVEYLERLYKADRIFNRLDNRTGYTVR